MNAFRLATPALAPLFAALCMPAPAAAETWATCTGTVSAVPAVIGSGGVWCLDRDLSTVATSGAAITVAASNVTIDCNGYKLGNLGAGTGTGATGIYADGRRNITLRNCHVRGFAVGIHLTGGVSGPITSSGHIVEDNVVEASTTQGIVVKARNGTVRRNRVLDTGPNPTGLSVAGIGAIGTVDVFDNLVEHVEIAAGSANPTWGIYAEALDGVFIGRNTLRDVIPTLAFAYGVYYVGTDGTLASIRDNNQVRNGTNTLWIYCSPGYLAAARENVASGWTTGSSNCYAFDEVEGW